MAIERWKPFTELMSLRQAMDRLFEDSFIRPSHVLTSLGEVAAPALDIYQTPGEVVVKAALPGVKPEDVNIDITGDTLTVKGESKAEQEVRREDYLYQERRYGAFSRTVVLPSGLKSDKAEAKMEDGILILTIPKAEEAKPKILASKLERRNDNYRAPLSDFNKSINCFKILAVAPQMICPSYS
jgi:HSP20 family protein